MVCMHGDVKFSVGAAFFCIAANFCRSVKIVWQHDLLQIDLSPYCIVAWIGIWTLVPLIALVSYYEGKEALTALRTLPMRVQLQIASSAAVASMLNVCQCVALKSLA